MAPCRAAAALLLLALTAALPSQQDSATSSSSRNSSASAGQQPSPLDQLKALLTPVVEDAVSRSNSGWQLSQLAAQLARLQLRLDMVVHDVTSLKLDVLSSRGNGVCHLDRPETQTGTETETKVEPKSEGTMVCETSPTPLPLDAAPHQEPTVRACAHSCLQLRNQGNSPQDGVYWFTGMSVPVICDFSHDEGGWTLLLTAVSHPGWDPLSALSRSPLSPSLTDNYSILQHADAIRNLGAGSRFAYRIEAQAEKGRRRWGGIWLAPRLYSFVDETGTQTEVSRVRFFNNWNYKNHGIKQMMPWINTGLHGTSPVLTTTTPGADNWWGTLVSHENETTYHHSPWIHPEAPASGTMLYWMREEAV